MAISKEEREIAIEFLCKRMEDDPGMAVVMSRYARQSGIAPALQEALDRAISRSPVDDTVLTELLIYASSDLSLRDIEDLAFLAES